MTTSNILGHRVDNLNEPFENWVADEVEFTVHTSDVWDYVVGYSHVDVGLVTYRAFQTLSDAYDYLEEQGAEFVSA